LGSLIDIKSLQREINKLKQDQEKKKKTKERLDKFLTEEYLKSTQYEYSLNLVEVVENELIIDESQNIGLQLFGEQAKNAASLAQILMLKYDIIISNPPFGLSMDITKDKLKKFYPNTYGDLISAFIEQSIRLLKLNGYIAMVSDFSFLHLPKFEKFRSNILLSASYIQYMILLGAGALPDAENHPLLLIIRKSDLNESYIGFYRDVNVGFSKAPDPEISIKMLNEWDEKKPIPVGWNKIKQIGFKNLPRSVIDLSIADKFQPLLEFFTKYPRLDISQHNRIEKEHLSNLEISRAFQGIATANNDLFIRFWFEVEPNLIRKVELIKEISDVPKSLDRPFVPFSKGGGDKRYYMNNGYILWWNKDAIKMVNENNGVIRNCSLIGRSDLHWSLASSRSRGRFNISQNGLMRDVVSMGIHI
ncbi:hypothetical protein LCGC14_2769900, partial [marine sediment metagenome]